MGRGRQIGDLGFGISPKIPPVGPQLGLHLGTQGSALVQCHTSVIEHLLHARHCAGCRGCLEKQGKAGLHRVAGPGACVGRQLYALEVKRRDSCLGKFEKALLRRGL